MMKRSTAGLVAVTWLFGTLACAGGSANEDDTAAAPQQDTAQARSRLRATAAWSRTPLALSTSRRP